MGMADLWVVCVSICALLPFLYLLWKHHPSYGANPGGPALPLVGSIPFILLNKHRLHEWTCDLFDRCPSLTRRFNVGPTVVLLTADPAVVQHILKGRFIDYPKGPSFSANFGELLGNGILNCDGALWRLQRKVASYVFTSSNSLRDFVVAIADAEIAHRLLPALDTAQHDGDGVVDLQALLLQYTFDTICQFTFGSDPACLNASKLKRKQANGNSESPTDVCYDDHASDDTSFLSSYIKVPGHLIQGFVHSFHQALQISAERFLIPEFVWKLKRALNIGSEKKLNDALKVVNEFTSFVIEQSKRDLASGKDRKHLLARFLRLSNNAEEIPADIRNQHDGEGSCISDALLRDILHCFILAGRETVASAVTFTMWLLTFHPRVEREVLKEINDILIKRISGHAPRPSNVDLFTYDEVRNMNYLQAVLSESMRLYPPVPSNCKYATQDDTFPDGTQVSKGDQVSYNVFAMGRAARVWGKDCCEFRPERWLDTGGAFVPASPFKYPVFQGGPRICLGKDFAFTQMKLLVASLLQNFAFVVQTGYKPTLSFGANLLMLHGLPVTVKKRLAPRSDKNS